MQIDPRAQLALLLAALSMGVLFGILWEVLAALRILCTYEEYCNAVGRTQKETAE